MEKQKFQFESEEQFDKFLDDCEISDKDLRSGIKYFAKFKGYIRKSELQILVEEAEDAIKEYSIYLIDESTALKKIINGFRALKKSHPEFKE